jgi:Na+/H+ antiporter NhaD/arsenite permease-like protein
VTTFNLNMTTHWIGILCLITFCLSYVFVITEEFTSLRKSKPVMLGAGIIWILVAMGAKSQTQSTAVMETLSHLILEYALLFLFLLVAMTYVNAIQERGVFESLKRWLIERQYTYKQLFWISGILAFFISPFADNLTTALVMCTIILACGKDQPRFVALSCINIVVAANSGGAFSPFGDITTLMVWQKGLIPFFDFFKIFVPCVVNFVIPAAIMHFAVPSGIPSKSTEEVSISHGGLSIVFLFLFTILLTVSLHHFLHLPPAFGMMVGLALLQVRSYFVKRVDQQFNIFRNIEGIEWDTLLFFYGIILCIGGLSSLGYLDIASQTLYEKWGAGLSAAYQATPANVIIGLLSAIIDNIPLMFAVLSMNPAMSEGQWLLITLTAGVGGSVLSVGSAAGVALMGQARGHYTFMSHLKWSWAILLGYFASIATHLWLNKALFNV